MARTPQLCFTPPEALTDPQGRPYFLWDMEMSLSDFREALEDPDPDVRAYFLGKLMRQAKPDDVFQFVTLAEVRADWDRVRPYLGQSRAMWTFLLDLWATHAA